METKSKFRSVSLKADLVDAVEDYIERDKRYRSIAEFMSEAARMRLQEMKGALQEAPIVTDR